jgi:hypothetical protein
VTIVNAHRIALILAVVVGGLAGRPASADEPSTHAAQASRLFEQARALMEAGRYAEACPLFAESEALDAHGGTVANLAFCYENVGKTASAWKWWIEAAVAYSARGRIDEAQVARGRAAQLEPRLARVTVSVEQPDDQAALEVLLDGEPLPKTRWNTAAPLDPGAHVVEARAPGRRRWSIAFEVAVDHVPEVTVPVLEPTPERAWTKTAGLAVGAGGLAAVAVGLGFAGGAIVAHSREAPYCSAVVSTNCAGNALGEQTQMKTDATIAEAALAVGGGALVAAAILWFAPSSVGPSAPVRGLTWRPSVGRNGASLSIGEAW